MDTYYLDNLKANLDFIEFRRSVKISKVGDRFQCHNARC